LKTPDNSKFREHPESLLIGYVENDLKPEERSVVEQHLKDCPKCAQSVRRLEGLTRSLRGNAEEIICPEASELHEFVRSGSDPGGKLARHLAQCASCFEEVSCYRLACAVSPSCQPIPGSVREAFEQNYPAPGERVVPSEETLWSKLLERISLLFRQPVLALGTAVAVILIVALLYPRQHTEPSIVFSHVKWGETGRKWTTMNISPGQGRPSVAMAIFSKDFTAQLSQQRIDEWYSSIEPTPEMKKRFEFINPAQLESLATTDQSKTVSPEELRELLSKKIGPIKVVMITLGQERDGFSIESRLVDSETGKTTGETTYNRVPYSDVSSKLRESAFALLGKQSVE
jgi:hypothetical protein